MFYRSNPAREAFVEMCESNYVQKMTFDSYLYKTGEQGERRRGAAAAAPPAAAAPAEGGALKRCGVLVTHPHCVMYW